MTARPANERREAGTPGVGIDIRPMQQEDCAAAAEVVDVSAVELFERHSVPTSPGAPGAEERLLEAMARFVRTDPDGCWVAPSDGVIQAVAVSIKRDAFWGLSILAVAPEVQSRGYGRRVLDRALAYGAESESALICSSIDPRAIRRYSRAGFVLHPAVQVRGLVDRTCLSARTRTRDGVEADLDLVAAVDTPLLGRSRADDVAFLLEQGARLVVADDTGRRGYAVFRDGNPAIDGCPMLLAADDEQTARHLLLHVYAESRGPVPALCWTRAQHWAVDTAIEVRLEVVPGGPLFTRGLVAVPGPWLPNGLYF